MTVEQFRAMSTYVKSQTLKHHGALLSVRKEVTMDVVLYQLEGFYVEVFFTAGNTKDTKFRSFTETSELEPYLSAIDVSELTRLL